ncbi:Plant organelle RNA recognition domain [Dillenia turbinata]|uniref:Plant organelle RNA recognition domain n=1 Tax=Dillenia turbinata TaxID=194707 RepID=A0AAN8URC4_9MAGN
MKDEVLDEVVAAEREVRPASILVSIINCGCLPVYHLSRHRRLLGLPDDLKLSTFVRRYPNIFYETYNLDSGGTSVPWYCLTPEAFSLYQEEVNIHWCNQKDLLGRLCKLAHAHQGKDASYVSDKRIVGVFHELLHLTVQKKTERRYVSNLRKPLSLPQKFTKVFERHPGIFYISKKNDTQTVVLREAYAGQLLTQKHPLVDLREKFANMMREGLVAHSQGLYKKPNRSWSGSNVD